MESWPFVIHVCVFMIFPSFLLMNVDPDAVLSVSMLDADAKVLIEMQEEDLRHRNSPGQAIQMGRLPFYLLKPKHHIQSN